jgi:hypothetical protein
MREKMGFEELYTPNQRFVKCLLKKMLNQSLFLWYEKDIVKLADAYRQAGIPLGRDRHG